MSKLNASGSALVYSTYFGGSVSDEGLGICCRLLWQCIREGFAKSTDFPTQAGSFQTTNPDPGLPVGFVTKLNSAGSALVHSTFLGGTDAFETIAHRYGWTPGVMHSLQVSLVKPLSPSQPRAVQTTLGGDDDSFIPTRNASGTTLLFSIFLGGIGEGFGGGIAVDSTGGAYLAGSTFSNGGFPTTAGAFQSSTPGQESAFVAKIAEIAHQLG